MVDTTIRFITVADLAMVMAMATTAAIMVEAIMVASGVHHHIMEVTTILW